jgi:drug/metabolite transporter (DMT)-like permease
MDTTTLATTTTLLAEVALALHPILIKQVNVGLPTQLVARLGTYTILGSLLSDAKDRAFSWGSISKASQSILFGLMNLVHIGSSYLSYNHLPAGSALALFYTYPFFNILTGIFFLGDSFKLALIPLFVLAFVGVLLISKYTTNGDESTSDQQQPAKKKNITLGIIASLVSALTETMIFMVAKTGEEGSPWITILKLYPAAFAGLIGWIFMSGTSWNTSFKNWTPLLLFNTFIGFLGYSLRFWSIPRLPTAVFSILSFIGVVAGYLWGIMYAKEIPTMGALTGAGLITLAQSLLKIYKI